VSVWGLTGSAPRPARAEARRPSAVRASPAAHAAAEAPAAGATLRQVQVVFRHGARTPLTDQQQLMLGHAWGPETCGPEYAAHGGGAPLDIRDRGGRPFSTAPADAAQMACALPGGACHKGQLTLLGQEQARGFCRGGVPRGLGWAGRAWGCAASCRVAGRVAVGAVQARPGSVDAMWLPHDACWSTQADCGRTAGAAPARDAPAPSSRLACVGQVPKPVTSYPILTSPPRPLLP
jgi:hypothetical protein